MRKHQVGFYQSDGRPYQAAKPMSSSAADLVGGRQKMHISRPLEITAAKLQAGIFSLSESV